MLSSQSGCLSKWPAFVFTDHKRLLVKTVSLIIRRSPSDLMWTAVLAYVTSLTTTIYWNSILLWWPRCSEVGLTISVGVQTPYFLAFQWRATAYRWRRLIYRRNNRHALIAARSPTNMNTTVNIGLHCFRSEVACSLLLTSKICVNCAGQYSLGNEGFPPASSVLESPTDAGQHQWVITDCFRLQMSTDILVTTNADLTGLTVHMCLFFRFPFYDVFCATQLFTWGQMGSEVADGVISQ